MRTNKNYVDKKIYIEDFIYNASKNVDCLLSILDLDFRKRGNTYVCIKSNGLKIYKNRGSGKWMVKNFSGKLPIPSGDIWQLTKHVYNLDTKTDEGFKKCLKIICDLSNQIYPLGEDGNVKTLPKPANRVVSKTDFIPNNARELMRNCKCAFASESSEVYKATLDYFGRYGVTDDTLKKYAVRALKSVTSVKGNYEIRFNAHDFAFAYIIGVDSNIKYKRPHAGKGNKERYIQSTGNYIFGWNQLPRVEERKDKTLLICAGEKDCIILNHHFNKFGFYAICLNGERSSIDKDFAKKLKDQFKGVYTIFDNDSTGKSQMQKHWEQHELPFIDISKHTSLNDVADVIERKGLERLKEIIRLETQKHRTIIHAAKGEKLTSILKDIDILNKRIIAPTGSGKTYMVSKVEDVKIIACPTIALVGNVCEEYGAYEFRQKSNQVKFLQGITNAKDLPPFIATTYHSLPRLHEILGNICKDVLLFFDEAHSFTASASKNFLHKNLKKILSIAGDFKAFTTLTGTELHTTHPFLKSLPIIEVKQQRDKVKCHFVDAEDTLLAAAKLFDESITKGRFPLLLLDDTSEKGKLGKLKFYINSEGYAVFNSHNKEDVFFKQLTSKGKIGSGIMGIITTSVLKVGNNIHDKMNFDVIVVGNFHSSDIEQFRKRPRKAKSLEIHMVRSEKRQKNNGGFDVIGESAYMIKKTQKIIDELNINSECESSLIAREFEVKQMIQFSPICLENDAYNTDHLLLDNMVFNYEKIQENRNDDLMKTNLAKYDIEVLDSVKCDIVASKEEKEEAAGNRREQKAKYETEFFKTIEGLARHQAPSILIEEELKFNRNRLSKVQKEVFKRFDGLMNVYENEEKVFEVLKEIGVSKSKYNLHRKRLTIFRLKEDKLFMDTNRTLPILLKAMYSKFSCKNLLTSEEMKEKLLNVLKIDKSIDLRKYQDSERNTKVLKTLKLFFHVEIIRKSIDGEKVWKYAMSSINFDNITNNNTKLMELQDTFEAAILQELR